MSGEILLPDGVTMTCRLGEGRVLDYCVVPAGLGSGFRMELAEAPWAAHVGFDLTLPGDFRPAQGWRLHLAPAFPARLPLPRQRSQHTKRARRAMHQDAACPVAAQPPDQPGEPSAPREVRADSREAQCIWRLAWAWAGLQPLAGPMPSPRLLARATCPGAACAADASLARWYQAVERYYHFLDPATKQRPAQGPSRAAGLGFTWGPAPKRPTWDLGWADRAAAWWAHARAFLKELGALTRRERACGQRDRCVRILARLAEEAPTAVSLRLPSEDWACASMDDQGEAWLDWARLCGALRGAGTLGPAALDRLQLLAGKGLQRASLAAMSEAGRAFTSWAGSAAEGGAGKLFRWVREDFREVPMQARVGGSFEGNPDLIMEQKRRIWQCKWQVEDTPGGSRGLEQQRILDLLGTVRQLRDEGGNTFARLTDGEFVAAVAAHKEATGKGVDRLAPSDLRQLPAEARQALYDIYDQCEAGWAWPHLWSTMLIHLVTKPAGDDRAIAALPLPVRVWGTARKWAADGWSAARAGFWDQAVKKSSALQAVARRCIADEAWQALGVTVAGSTLDAKSFYDELSYDLLLRECLNWGSRPSPSS